MRTFLRIVIIAAAATLLISTAATAGTPGKSNSLRVGGLVHLSKPGATEWNFEALLREIFGSGDICSINSKPGTPLNFPKNDHGCVPLATYAPWNFDFTGLGRSSFHVTKWDYTLQGWCGPLLVGPSIT
jgi:hypothetical protein